MLEDVIYKNYGLVMERQEMDGSYSRFFSKNVLYTIVPIYEVNENELMERLKLSDFMNRQGDPYVSLFVPTVHETFLSESDDTVFLLMANDNLEKPRPVQMGKKLAKFHSRGRTFAEPLQECNRIGKWKELWEERIDRLENVWHEKIQSNPANEFERMFVESFPYFSSLGENAIQYLVDCEIDDDPSGLDAGTVCHERFYNDLWLGEYLVKNPFDWVFDHHCRDVSEWIREHYFRFPHTYRPDMVRFVEEYSYYTPLSSFSWRLLYARLLFPVHYLEAIERYYSSDREEEKRTVEDFLQDYLKRTHHHEEFLRDFYEVLGVPISRLRIPRVDWL